MKRVSLPVFFLLLCMVLVRADEIQDQLNSLQIAFATESESIHAQLEKLQPSVTGNDSHGAITPEEAQKRQALFAERQKLQEEIQRIEMFRAALARFAGKRSSVGAVYLDELRQNLETIPEINPKLRAQTVAFLDNFRALQQKQAEQYQKQVDEALKRALSAVDSATDADALNGVVGELSALSQAQWNTDSSPDRLIQGQLTSAVTALTTWQSYLRNYKAGYFTAASNDLRGLLSNNSQYPFFPADRIRTEMDKIKDQAGARSRQILEILVAVKQVSDIPAAATRLNTLSVPGEQEDYNQSLNPQAVIERIQIFASLYAAIQYGANQKDGFSGYPNAASAATPELFRIENLIRLYALTQAFASLGVAAPEPNENSKAYLDHLVTAAAKAKNWELVARLFQLSKELSPPPDGVTEDQLTPVKAYLSAQHLEAAGQYVPAILAYRTVVANPGNYLPVDEVAAHLKQLSEDHKDILADVAAQETRQQENMRNQQTQMQQVQQIQMQQMQRMQQMQGMPGMPQQSAPPPPSSPVPSPKSKTR